MPNPVKGLLEVFEDMVEVSLMLEIFFTEDLYKCRLKICSVVLLPALRPACSSAMTFSACGFNLFSMIFSMTWVTDEADHLVVLALLQVACSGQVLWTCTGRNNSLLPSTSLPAMGEIAGVNTASLGGYLPSLKMRARWSEGFHNELNSHFFNLERDGLRQVVPCP